MPRLLPSALVLAAAAVSACSTPPPQATAEEVSRASSSYSVSEFECLREAIYFEAHASNTAGQHAVADVIKNRAEDPRFPGSICGVISDGCQFSYRCDGRPENFPDKVKYENASRVAKEALVEKDEDITGGALFFHAARMAPGWFATLKRVGDFGGNIFYRG